MRNWKVDLRQIKGGAVDGFKERSYATREAAERAAGALAVDHAGKHAVRLREAGQWVDALIYMAKGNPAPSITGRYSFDISEGVAQAASGK